MNRRDFLRKLLVVSGSALILPSTKIIFDMGRNLHKYETVFVPFNFEPEIDVYISLNNGISYRLLKQSKDYTIDHQNQVVHLAEPANNIKIGRYYCIIP